ncbi:MAG: 5-oxoprolinase subunit PxpB [Acidobacteriota bacterium]|nr:5-oxoprolinase subunit PxpB [Acidobacteriota bacterium]
MSLSIARMGDAALVVTFAADSLDAANGRAIALAAALRADAITGVLDVVPAMTSVAVHFEPGTDAFERAIAHVRTRAVEMSTSASVEAAVDRRLHEIPVFYGGADGPDLADVASFGGCSEEDVIARHASGAYRVYMLGFIPGFAYLGPVDPSIAAPRRPAPRQRVPAGSVGIAGTQTGVYPQQSPGGWQIIGRTDLRMFDAATGSRLQPGDHVRFVARRAP